MTANEYVPSPWEPVRDQVAAYERSDGTEANTLPGTEYPDHRPHDCRRPDGQDPQDPPDAGRTRWGVRVARLGIAWLVGAGAALGSAAISSFHRRPVEPSVAIPVVLAPAEVA